MGSCCSDNANKVSGKDSYGLQSDEGIVDDCPIKIEPVNCNGIPRAGKIYLLEGTVDVGVIEMYDGNGIIPVNNYCNHKDAVNNDEVNQLLNVTSDESLHIKPRSKKSTLRTLQALMNCGKHRSNSPDLVNGYTEPMNYAFEGRRSDSDCDKSSVCIDNSRLSEYESSSDIVNGSQDAEDEAREDVAIRLHDAPVENGACLTDKVPKFLESNPTKLSRPVSMFQTGVPKAKAHDRPQSIQELQIKATPKKKQKKESCKRPSSTFVSASDCANSPIKRQLSTGPAPVMLSDKLRLTLKDSSPLLPLDKGGDHTKERGKAIGNTPGGMSNCTGDADHGIGSATQPRSTATAGSGNDGNYFLDLLTREERRLRALCTQWEAELDPSLGEDSAGKVRSAVGKTNLLLSRKFKQFHDLCRKNLDSRAERRPTYDDLLGYWEMVLIQICDLDTLFADLQAMKSSNWQSRSPLPNRKTCLSSPLPAAPDTSRSPRPSMAGRAAQQHAEARKKFLSEAKKLTSRAPVEPQIEFYIPKGQVK